MHSIFVLFHWVKNIDECNIHTKVIFVTFVTNSFVFFKKNIPIEYKKIQTTGISYKDALTSRMNLKLSSVFFAANG